MLSTNLHQYSAAFSHVSALNMMGHDHQHQAAQPMAPSPPKPLLQPSENSADQFHPARNVLSNGKAVLKPHRLSYASGLIAPRHQRDMHHERSGRGSASIGPVRRRISRACDQCNQLRTKCDGRQSCAHCIEFGLTCEYIRERKKRGKASRKDIAQQQVTALGIQPPEDTSTQPSSDSAPERTRSSNSRLPESQRSLAPSLPAIQSTPNPEIDSEPMYRESSGSIGSVEVLPEPQTYNRMGVQVVHAIKQSPIQAQGLLIHDSIQEYHSMDEYSQDTSFPSQLQSLPLGINREMQPLMSVHGHRLEYSESPYDITSPHGTQAQEVLDSYRIIEEPQMCHVPESLDLDSPEWLLRSPSAATYPDALRQNFTQSLRFPVLRPLIPHLADIMPAGFACDLLEFYFQSSSSASIQLVSPYALRYVFRKRSFLRQKNPRVCNLALLASILWIGCLTSESPYLSSSPSTRSQLSEKLVNLTISLLKPSMQQTPPEYKDFPTTYSPTHGSHVFPTERAFDTAVQDYGASLARSPGKLDEVATYMNLAIVLSQSEYKAASFSWWDAAWSLARELQFGNHVPVTPPSELENEATEDLNPGNIENSYSASRNNLERIAEEQRLERRRIWWLLHTMDRHLALCYNRPLSLLDVECSRFLQPMDDNEWQPEQFFDVPVQLFSDST